MFYGKIEFLFGECLFLRFASTRNGNLRYIDDGLLEKGNQLMPSHGPMDGQTEKNVDFLFRTGVQTPFSVVATSTKNRGGEGKDETFKHARYE